MSLLCNLEPCNGGTKKHDTKHYYHREANSHLSSNPVIFLGECIPICVETKEQAHITHMYTLIKT